MISKVWENISAVALSAGGFAVLGVTLGRLWTSSYYDTFGLPTSDLQLTTEDYAYRAKEALAMITIAVIVASGFWLLFRLGEASRQPPDAHPGGRRLLLTAVAGVEAVLLLAVAGVAGVAGLWQRIEGLHPTVLTTALGFLVGVIGGFLAHAITTSGRRWHRLVAFLVLVAVTVGFLPVAVVQLAHRSATFTMQSRDLTHAVIEFNDVAPAAIRRSDDPTRSVRVYIVLLTPERLAVALPYPCSRVTTTEAREIPLNPLDFDTLRPASNVCDTVVFDRDQVKSIRVLGKGGRPSNDEPDQADEVALAAEPVDGEVRTRTVYQQAFDFKEARPLRVTCEDRHVSGEERRVQGVWVRLAPRDPGWVSIEGGPESLFQLTVGEPDTCRDFAPERFRVSPGRDHLVYLYAPRGDSDLDVKTVTIRYTPVATTVELAEASRLRVAVEIVSRTDPCDRPAPTIAAPGVAPEPSDCGYDRSARTATYNFEPVATTPPGSWRVTVCSGEEDLTAIRVTASAVAPAETPPPGEPTPAPDDGSGTDEAASEDTSAEKTGTGAGDGTAPMTTTCPAAPGAPPAR